MKNVFDKDKIIEMVRLFLPSVFWSHTIDLKPACYTDEKTKYIFKKNFLDYAPVINERYMGGIYEKI